MKHSFVSSILWPLSLIALGSCFLYTTVHALDKYLITGLITWGKANKGMSGPPALLAHLAWGALGAYGVAKGINQLVRGASADRGEMPE